MDHWGLLEFPPLDFLVEDLLEEYYLFHLDYYDQYLQIRHRLNHHLHLLQRVPGLYPDAPPPPACIVEKMLLKIEFAPVGPRRKDCCTTCTYCYWKSCNLYLIQLNKVLQLKEKLYKNQKNCSPSLNPPAPPPPIVPGFPLYHHLHHQQLPYNLLLFDVADYQHKIHKMFQVK